MPAAIATTNSQPQTRDLLSNQPMAPPLLLNGPAVPRGGRVVCVECRCQHPKTAGPAAHTTGGISFIATRAPHPRARPYARASYLDLRFSAPQPPPHHRNLGVGEKKKTRGSRNFFDSRQLAHPKPPACPGAQECWGHRTETGGKIRRPPQANYTARLPWQMRGVKATQSTAPLGLPFVKWFCID